MKYAHFADLHLGSWRDPKMRDLSTKAFLMAMDQCREQHVDFILFAGDIFNTSLPALDTLKIVTKKLKELHDKDIPVYVIAGSHDFSPSGKSMIEVLEHAGLVHNVCKGKILPETQQLQLDFTIDHKTGAKITGIIGRKGQLDKFYYENLSIANLEQEAGYKIFLFHTTITEMKPKELEKVESQPASFLPKGFNYYAGGHIHHPTRIELPEYGTLTYPGALFPNNFTEVEKYSHGGYYVITVDGSQPLSKQRIDWIPIEVVPHEKIIVCCDHKSPEVVSFELSELIAKKNLNNRVVTIRLRGTLEQGKVSDINFREIHEQLTRQGAYFVMKNISQVSSQEFAEIKIIPTNPETMEEEIIKEHLQQQSLFTLEQEAALIRRLLVTLNQQKAEGETFPDFYARLETEINQMLKH